MLFISMVILMHMSRSDRSSESAPASSKTVTSWKGDRFFKVLDSDEKFSRTKTPLLKQPAVICNVKSVAWSHCADAYDRNGESAFRDILFVSSGDEIYVHAFRECRKTNQVIKSLPGTGNVDGRWVVWGPTFKDSCAYNEMSDSDRRQEDNYFEGSSSSVDNSASKHWLRSFLIDAGSSQDAGGFVLRFPIKSSLPSSAEVLSFNIFERILILLDQCTGSEERTCENTSELGDSKSDIDVSGTEGHSLKTMKKDMFRCSRVFSSIHGNYVALTLTNAHAHHINEEHVACSKTTVVILAVSVKGLQWTCSVNLPESSSGWFDFQIFKGLLACLNGSGIVSVFDAESGDALFCLSALKSSFVNVRENSELDEVSSFLNGNSPPMKQGKNIFRRLLFASDSPSLAVIDDNGVIYLVDFGAFLVEELHEIGNFQGAMSRFQKLGWGMRSGWKFTSSEINHHKEFSDFYPGSERKISRKFSTSEFEPKKKGKPNLKSMKEEMDYYPSGFSAQMKDRSSQFGHCIKLCVMRRVFLPLEKYSIDDAISFSSFGISRLVRLGREEAKIQHIGLQSAPLAYDDCLLSSWTSSFLKEKSLGSCARGCFFEGCLYVIMDEGLYVVLPSNPVSSGAPLYTSFEYSQSKEALYAGDECRSFFRPWQIEILDRTLLYEGPDEADYFCLKTGKLSFAEFK